tara:strand:- start:599 stop:736 length:138 start_codon:yes stop_codon:yes gene_type:complete
MLHHAPMAALTGPIAALEVVMNGSNGPFASADTKRGKRSFAAGAS